MYRPNPRKSGTAVRRMMAQIQPMPNGSSELLLGFTLLTSVRSPTWRSAEILSKAIKVRCSKIHCFRFISSCKVICHSKVFRAFRKQKLQERYDRIQADLSDHSDTDADEVELDGGLRIPCSIWDKLYKCGRLRIGWEGEYTWRGEKNISRVKRNDNENWVKMHVGVGRFGADVLCVF